MLSEAERREIDAERAHYRGHRQAVCLEALKIVQRHRGGWLADEALADLAAHLGFTVEALDSLATFYNLLFRKPVGRHVVLLCDSVSCWIMGCERVRRELEARHGLRMGATSADGRFTLLTVPCLGACDRAPALQIGDELHGRLAPETLGALLERYP